MTFDEWWKECSGWYTEAYDASGLSEWCLAKDAWDYHSKRIAERFTMSELPCPICRVTGGRHKMDCQNAPYVNSLGPFLENIKLRGLMGEALSNMEYYSASLGEYWLVKDSDIIAMQEALQEKGND